MSAAEFLKGQCRNCGNSIEFPADGVGQTTTCPHCGQPTVLQAGTANLTDAAAPPRKSSAVLISIAVVALVAIGGFVALKLMNKTEAASPGTTAPIAETSAAGVAETNPATHTAAPQKAPAQKSLADLKAGPVTLEKTKGSSLVYAVGVLRNESDHQRFGVNIELEVTDARGNKAGTAKDYRAVLEPRQEWRFRALVLDSKATAATVSSIREE